MSNESPAQSAPRLIDELLAAGAHRPTMVAAAERLSEGDVDGFFDLFFTAMDTIPAQPAAAQDEPA